MPMNLTSFLIGFLSASILCAAFAVWYYCRARRRIRAIQASIRHYAEAQSVVGSACDKVYPCKPCCGGKNPSHQ